MLNSRPGGTFDDVHLGMNEFKFMPLNATRILTLKITTEADVRTKT